MEWLKGYQSDIIAFWLGIAKILVNVGIASILSLYLLIGKNKLKADYFKDGFVSEKYGNKTEEFSKPFAWRIKQKNLTINVVRCYN